MKKLHWLSRTEGYFPLDLWRELAPELKNYELIEFPLEQEVLRREWKQMLQESSGIFLERAFSAEILSLIVKIPRDVLDMQCADIFLKDNLGTWWPECLFRESLHREIVHWAPDLDTSGIAYITGNGPEMRTALSVAVQLGFRKVNIVFPNTQVDSSLGSSLQRIYFDTQLVLLRSTDLTLQKNDGTLLINTVNFTEFPELRDDLSYLNFILADGLVVDTQGALLKNSMLDEATNVGLRTLNGYRMRANLDWRILTRVLGALAITEDEFETKWEEFLQLK